MSSSPFLGLGGFPYEVRDGVLCTYGVLHCVSCVRCLGATNYTRVQCIMNVPYGGNALLKRAVRPYYLLMVEVCARSHDLVYGAYSSASRATE